MNAIEVSNLKPSATAAPAGASQKAPSSDSPVLRAIIPTPSVTITEIPPTPGKEPQATQPEDAEHLEISPLKTSGNLTPSGPPESHHAFSMQDFKRSFYQHWMKDKSIEKCDPFGFSSASSSRSHSPAPCTYAEALARRGSVGGEHR